MKISTKARYGMKAVVELAINYGQGPLSLRDIAQKYDISLSYLEQLISTLKKEGFVSGVRGKMGGYELTRAPSDIMVGDILKSLEHDFIITECGSSMLERDVKKCEYEEICKTKNVWIKLQHAIDQTLNGLSLEDLIREESTKEARQ